MSNRRDLTTEQKAFIVVALACFKSPSEVVALVKEEFKLTINRQHVRHYNPEQSPELAAEWKELFEKTRAAFIAETANIGVYHQSYRLAELQELVHRAKAAGNLVLAGQFLKQAAEEVGGVFTNRREISGKDGGPIVHEHRDYEALRKLPADELARLHRSTLGLQGQD